VDLGELLLCAFLPCERSVNLSITHITECLYREGASLSHGIRLAADHRRRRRAAVLAAGSTAPICGLIEEHATIETRGDQV
jgi:hypothetical protein